MFKNFLIFNLIIITTAWSQNVVINEISAHKGYFDYHGEEYDWIELYNNSNSEINLSNYYLSDDLNNLENGNYQKLFLNLMILKHFIVLAKIILTV